LYFHIFRPIARNMAAKKLLFILCVLATLVTLETTYAHCGESSTHGELHFSHGLSLPGLDSCHGADTDLAGGMKVCNFGIDMRLAFLNAFK
jgi:hypothetical protein